MNETLFAGLTTGMLFGCLLHWAGVLRYEKQVGALRLIDMTIVKFMLSAAVVGMVGLYALVHFGLASLSVKPTQLGANVLGGLIFGAGWALFGYCPGTSLGALGEGRWHVLAGIAGMLAGAGVYAEVAPFMTRTVGTWGDFGRITLADVLGVSPWAVIGGFVVLGAALCLVFEKKRL